MFTLFFLFISNRCTLCEKSFLTASGLNLHIKNRHVPDNEKPFKCPICGKAFATNTLFVRHKKVYHIKNEDKKFECYRCNHRFDHK